MVAYLVIGLDSTELKPQEVEYLKHPSVAGVILFTRNYQNKPQLLALNNSIKSINPDLFISVDHEGGRVQRFREGFIELPPASTVQSIEQAYSRGQLIGHELKSVGIDINFAPVVDVMQPGSKLLEGRCFEVDVPKIVSFALAECMGMAEYGIEGVIKHYPGHGGVLGDTHTESVVDHRSYQELLPSDMLAFYSSVLGGVQNIMASWVIYEQCDSNPACFSEFWLKKILRDEWGFKGKVFSDDMGMKAAKVDDPAVCIKKARDAGCDYVLLCNEFNVIEKILKNKR